MRLLYLTADPGVPVFGGKGASVHVRSMVEAFAGLGQEVILASPRIEPGEERLPKGVRCVEIPAVRPRDLATAPHVSEAIAAQTRAVRELARREQVDGIYERYSLSSPAGARTASELGIPLLLEVNAPLREEERRFRHLAHESIALEAERETFAAAAQIIAVSDWLAGWLYSQGVSRQRIAVIANPPPQELLETAPPPEPADTVTVGFLGSLKPWHGVETLVDGFLRAASQGARMRLEIVGDGPLAGALAQAADQSDRIRRVGHIPHRQALARLSTWHVGAAPYTSIDGFYFSPLKLAEYMAAGLCPVVTDVGQLPNMVDQGRAGVIIPPDDPSALAEALLLLDGDRARLRRLASRARSLAQELPTWSEIATRLCAVLEGLGQPGQPAGTR